MRIKNKERKEMKIFFFLFPSTIYFIFFVLFLMTEMKNGSAGIRVISSSNYNEKRK